MGRPVQNFTMEQRLQFLRVLEAVDMNEDKAREETGMNPSRATIINWKNKYGEMVFGKQMMADTAELVSDFADKQRKHIDRAYNLLDMAYDRAEELIPTQNNLSKITELVRELNKVTLGLPPEDMGKDDDRGHKLIQKITNQLTINSYGKKDN